jgi:hypothetical protein
MGEHRRAARTAAVLTLAALALWPAAAVADPEVIASRAGLDGPPGNGSSSDAALSDDARYAVFVTAATNLTAEDTTNDLDVVRKDLQTGEVRLVSNGALTVVVGFGGTGRPSVSADGRHVAFLARENGTGPMQAFVRDLAAAGPQRLTPQPADQDVYAVSLSADGRRAVFASGAGNITADVDADLLNVFGWTADGVFGIGAPSPSGCGQTPVPSISPDGGWVVSEGTVPGTCDDAVVKAHFERTPPFTAVEGSTADNNAFFPLASDGAAVVAWGADQPGARVLRRNGVLLDSGFSAERFGLSYDGTRIAWATSTTPPATGTTPDVVLRDTATGQTLLVSETAGAGSRAAISGDGASVAFGSAGQVHVRKLLPRPPRNRVAPTVSGPDAFGTLTCSPGDWAGSPGEFRYQWLRAGQPIPGATSSTYTPSVADLDQPIACAVTAVNADGAATATSAPVVRRRRS